jgi:hypothetical protein
LTIAALPWTFGRGALTGGPESARSNGIRRYPAGIPLWSEEVTMSEPCIQVVPDTRGAWAVKRPGESSPLSTHGSLTEAERHALRERRAGERIIIRDRYGRERTAPAGRR